MKKIYYGIIAIIIIVVAPVTGYTNDPIGRIKETQGQVLINNNEGEPFIPAKTGVSLFKGGAVVVMDDASVVLDINGRGTLHLTDNAAIQLKDVEATGEFTRVTGVRAPVLFLYPTGQSDESTGLVKLVFGINHNLDKIKGLRNFNAYAIFEDAEDELDEDAPLNEVTDHSILLGSFNRKKNSSINSYSWYELNSKSSLNEDGEYTIYITAQRDGKLIRLGQSTLLIVENHDNDD